MYKYSSIRIVNQYLEKQHYQLQYSVYIQFLLFCPTVSSHFQRYLEPFLPIPSSGVMSYICNTIKFFCHSLHSMLEFPPSTLLVEFCFNFHFKIVHWFLVLWCSVGFDKWITSCIHHCSARQNSLMTLKNCALPSHSSDLSRPLTETDLFSVFSRKSYKWNHTGCRLLRLDSFTWHNALRIYPWFIHVA